MSSSSCRLRVGRRSVPGGIYLVTTNCHQRRPLLAEPASARIVLDALHWLDKHGQLGLIAAVAMPDHLHFVAELRHEPLARPMNTLKGFTARQMNRLAGRNRPVWQPGYHDHALRAEEDLVDVVGYCLQNPERAGLVGDFRDYPHLWCKWPI